MESSNLSHLHSSSLGTHTPIKRLGLSRKRKSILSFYTQHNKIIKKSDNECFLFDKTNVKAASDKTQLDNETVSKEHRNEICETSIDEAIDYEKEIKLVESRIEEKLKILSALKNKNGKKLELQNLIQLWKNGFKSAFLLLNNLLEERQKENIRPKIWLKGLGVWKLMVDNFQEDSEICLSDDSD